MSLPISVHYATSQKVSEQPIYKSSSNEFEGQGKFTKFKIAQPYLFSEGSIIQRNHGDLILKNEIIEG